MDTLSETDRDDDYPQPHEHRLWLTLPAGLLATAGGGCAAAGVFQRYGSTPVTLRSMVTLPDWRLYLGLAVAVGVCGLLAVVGGRTALARTGAGALAVPAVLLAALNAGTAIRALDPLVSADGVQAIGPGAWLAMGGAAGGLVAALLVLGQSGGYAMPGFGVAAPALAALGAAGLLHSWLAAMVGGTQEGQGYLAALTAGDHSGAATFAVVGGLGLAAAALGAVSGRRSAVAAGVALGGAIAAAVDLGVRSASVQGLLDAGAARRQETFIALAATVLVLLLLAVLLRGRRIPPEEYGPPERAGAAAFDRDAPPGPGGFGPGGPDFDRTDFDRPEFDRTEFDRTEFDRAEFDRPEFDRAGYQRPGGYDRPAYGGGRPAFDRPDPGGPFDDRPYQPAGPQPPGGIYLPEHDPAPGARYPLVPDERAAQHPAPPRPGAGQPPRD
jgi:hypothetical protein